MQHHADAPNSGFYHRYGWPIVPEKVFTIDRIGCSASIGIPVQHPSDYPAPTHALRFLKGIPNGQRLRLLLASVGLEDCVCAIGGEEGGLFLFLKAAR